MLALGLLGMVMAVMWTTQTISLRCVGKPVVLRIDHADLPRRWQQLNRIVTNLAFAAAIVLYPLLRHDSPIRYYASLLPLDRRIGQAAQGAAAALIYLGLLYAVWLITDNVYLRPIGKVKKLAKRLGAVPFSAVIGAGIEELLFRAMLMASLMESFGTIVAVIVGTLVFAGAHYIRRVKRYWTFPGHLALGMMLCVAFACTHTLWLPLGLHGGGILIIMGLRPLVRYVGPPWLVGASIFPYAGVVGVVGLSILTLNMWYLHGGGQ